MSSYVSLKSGYVPRQSDLVDCTLCVIWESRGGGEVVCCLLRCCAMKSGRGSDVSEDADASIVRKQRVLLSLSAG